MPARHAARSAALSSSAAQPPRRDAAPGQRGVGLGQVGTAIVIAGLATYSLFLFGENQWIRSEFQALAVRVSTLDALADEVDKRDANATCRSTS